MDGFANSHLVSEQDSAVMLNTEFHRVSLERKQFLVEGEEYLRIVLQILFIVFDPLCYFSVLVPDFDWVAHRGEGSVG